MVSLRLGFVTAAVLASSLLVSAVPVPTWPPHNGPAAHRVEEGDVYRANPANFQPPHPGHTAHGGGTMHPVVAIGRTSPGGHVPAVAMSHNHPPHMQDDVRPASDYDRYTRHHGNGEFQHGTEAAIGNPIHVHHTDLHPPNANLPHQLHHEDTRRLVEDTYHSSGYHSTNPHHPHPSAQQQAASAPWHDPQHHAQYGHPQQHAAAYPHAAYGYGQHPHQQQQQHAAAYGGQHPHQQQHAAAYPQAYPHPHAQQQQHAVYPPGHPYAGWPVQPHAGHSGQYGQQGHPGHNGHNGSG
ncbi:hypothetical protein CVT26_009850 [Gymnopilus dilepis]|uniref:Uncharacterized protein n=1 Tax=Gymnopilus dilepis TaxID=231916 RepID=A0A409WCP6_9AGAR|nr:hypothetical protein CVT26_009850 [Gymnopilus dilepis]